MPVTDSPIKQAVVVLPTYDEKENIADIVAAILDQQSRVPAFKIQVVISDSNSKDGTIAIAEGLAQQDPRVHLLVTKQRGIGIGLLNGIRCAIDTLGADVIIAMDSDFQHNPDDIPRLLEKLAEGYELVIASRFAEGVVNEMPWYRWVMSVVANQMIRLMLNIHNVKEITTSYRAFTSSLFNKIEGMAIPWQQESFIAVPVYLVRMLHSGAKVTEIPMTMHARAGGYSKMIYWKYILDVTAFCIKSGFKPYRSDPLR
jgi:dolichol-phosphate mannosyltransferase